MRHAAEHSSRRNVGIMIGAFVLAVCASLAVSLEVVQRKHQELALGTARAFFDTMIAARQWNAEQNGLYALVSTTLQPNPYLDDPLRDVTTTDGLQLTKVNPAYMTRLISERLAAAEGVNYHLTSLRPLRPQNVVDAWEQAALEAFGADASERHAVVEADDSETFRYMAPLLVRQECVACHLSQGYAVGDVRGGLRVSFPYEPYAAAVTAEQWRLVAGHAIVMLLGLALLITLGRRLIARISQLSASLTRIETLEGLLPICAGCKSIRVDSDKVKPIWVSVESYLVDRTRATFSHGFCPDCVAKLYPSLGRWSRA